MVEALDILSKLPLCQRFHSTGHGSLLGESQRLNRLPRSDPFWHNTNRRPTLFKLGDFGEYVRGRIPILRVC